MSDLQAISLVKLADGSALTALEIVRTIPKRRLVCRAQWNGQSVFAKIFLGTDAARYAKRDADGIAVMLQAGIATPKLLHKGAGNLQDDSAVQVILLEEVVGAHTADAWWTALKPKERLDLASKLVKTVASHHVSGILHTDIHLKNFLVARDIVYTLDGDGVRKYTRLTFKLAQKNLAELISKFDVLEQADWLPELLRAYSEICQWSQPPKVAQIARLANRFRLKAAHDYADNKVFRNCTDVLVRYTDNGFQAINSDYSVEIMGFRSEELDNMVAQSQFRLKSGNSATVVVVDAGNKPYALKRYNIKNVWHGLKRAIQPSRAAVSWANAHRLGLLGIATAKPAMMLETRKFGLLGFKVRGKAYFVSEYLDVPDAQQFFALTRDKLHRAEAVRNICTLFYRLYLLQISHGDMKATNIKIQGTAPVLIDLDAMRQHKSKAGAKAAHVRDLKRFMQNWESDNALYNGFVKTFRVIYQDETPLQQAGIFQNKETV